MSWVHILVLGREVWEQERPGRSAEPSLLPLGGSLAGKDVLRHAPCDSHHHGFTFQTGNWPPQSVQTHGNNEHNSPHGTQAQTASFSAMKRALSSGIRAKKFQVLSSPPGVSLLCHLEPVVCLSGPWHLCFSSAIAFISSFLYVPPPRKILCGWTLTTCVYS